MKRLLSFIFSAIFIVLIASVVAEQFKVNLTPVVAILGVIFLVSLFFVLPRGALFALFVPRGWGNRPLDNTGRLFTIGYQEAIAYAAAITLVPKLLNREIFKFAQLTGALTLNITTTGLLDGDEVEFWFENDATQRIVTLNTGFLSSGTVTIPISKTAIVVGVYDKTLDKVRIKSREITA